MTCQDVPNGMKKLAVILLAILLALITLFAIDAAMAPANTPLDVESLTQQEYNIAVAANEIKESQLFDFTPYLVQP